MAKCWLNGQIIDEAQASVSIKDTGLLHAAGAFTTMRAYGGRVLNLQQHLARLRGTCSALFVPLTHNDAEIEQATRDLLAGPQN